MKNVIPVFVLLFRYTNAATGTAYLAGEKSRVGAWIPVHLILLFHSLFQFTKFYRAKNYIFSSQS